jgi:hypothetical protein
MNRKDFMRTIALGLGALIVLPYSKRRRRVIRHAISTNSGLKSSLSSYNWVHTAPSPVDAKNYGLLVGVGIFGTQTVSSITITASGVTRNMSRVDSRSDAGLNLGIELWYINDVSPVDQTVEVTFSGSTTSISGASTYAWMSAFGAVSGGFGGAGVTFMTKRDDSIAYGVFLTEATSGAKEKWNLPMNNRVKVESASGSFLISDRGPEPVNLEDGLEVTWEGYGASDTAIIAAEIFYNNITAVAGLM